MQYFKAPVYTSAQLASLDYDDIVFPFSDSSATYSGRTHHYTLTKAYFTERGRNLDIEVEGNDPNKINMFLKAVSDKVYLYIYNHSQSSKPQLDYMIAVRGVHGMDKMEFRDMFLEAMYIEGCYLLDNGDISNVSGIDLDIMQNMSEDVMRYQDRDMHKDCIGILRQLGLNYYGRYKFIPQGANW